VKLWPCAASPAYGIDSGCDTPYQLCRQRVKLWPCAASPAYGIDSGCDTPYGDAVSG